MDKYKEDNELLLITGVRLAIFIGIISICKGPYPIIHFLLNTFIASPFFSNLSSLVLISVVAILIWILTLKRLGIWE